MDRMIVFDMDGTIANLYAIPDWLDKLRAEDASPYAEAAPMWNMEELRQVLLALMKNKWKIHIVSWLSKGATVKYKREICRAKKEWLTRYNFPVNRIHFVDYGTNKANVIRRWTSSAILIDDDEKVRDSWTLGETIDPTEINNLSAELEKFLKNS